MQIPDDVAAELGEALARARRLIPPAWIKREGGRLDAAVAFQGVYDLAKKAGLIPAARPRQPATVHAFPVPGLGPKPDANAAPGANEPPP